MKTILTSFFYFLIAVVAVAGNIKPFQLSDVKLLESEFKHAQNLDAKYILAHDADRLLAPYLIDAGLEPKAERYGNWENTGLDGHIGGHYLTALAQMWVANGETEMLERLNYMIDELERCQKANGNGYVGGVPGGMIMWADIKAGKIDAGAFSLNGKWVPLYNIHKIFAGLLDAYRIAGIEKAKTMLVDLSDWFYDMVAGLTDEQVQDMLRSEHGGLNEVFADVAAITGDQKYMNLARRTSHRVILDPLLEKKDKLNGLHANTQIPKVIGFQQIADVDDDDEWYEASKFFWETVVQRRTISIGGNSVREHFHPADNFSSMVESREGPETCNTYNMLKLSKQLYFYDESLRYIDYYERALYNHILSTLHPKHGGLVYFTTMRPRHYRVYSKPEEAFWCCVGSGIENHGKYGEIIYAHDDKNLYVNLFIPSELSWDEKGIKLTQETRFPDEETTALTIDVDEPSRFTLNIRYPRWVNDGEMRVSVNGKNMKVAAQPGTYVALTRKWKSGDRVEVKLPMHFELEQLPDQSDYLSFVYGPIVLGAKTGTNDLDGLVADDSRMGHIAQGKLYPVDEAPMFVTDKPLALNPERLETSKLKFAIPAEVYPESGKDLVLEPFYRIHDARYEVYFPFANPADFTEKQEKLKKEEQARMALEAQTIDYVSPGEQQPESDHNFKAEKTEAGVHRDRHWRHAQGWFSYDLKDPEKEARKVRITYFGMDRDRTFDILISDKVIATVTLDDSKGGNFYSVDYELPEVLVENGNGILTIKFKAKPGSIAGGIYGVRLMR
ncbi:MAG: glycoside hydrolase family 127 protein [Prolixibacteraceae bacterium]|jgi:DUF1680 family protein|nr:glycoside hydrolase family 127 protein [Prolixibacteraceae bacterium]